MCKCVLPEFVRDIDTDQDKSGPIWIDIEELEEANTQTF